MRGVDHEFRRVRSTAAACCAVWLWQALAATTVAQFIPFQDDPIRYYVDPPRDPVAKLQGALDSGDAKIEFDDAHGYLRSVLRALEIPISSQTLVYSRSSLQFRNVTPATPRVLYFNDDVYVGWVQGGEFLEIASFDADQGAVFYTLDQEASPPPAFKRGELDCLQCHVGPRTQKVPGVLLRSSYTTETGDQAPRTKTFTTDHRSPFSERWGGGTSPALSAARSIWGT